MEFVIYLVNRYELKKKVYVYNEKGNTIQSYIQKIECIKVIIAAKEFKYITRLDGYMHIS